MVNNRIQIRRHVLLIRTAKCVNELEVHAVTVPFVVEALAAARTRQYPAPHGKWTGD